MKKIIFSMLVLASFGAFMACNNASNNDSKDAAKEDNKQKFDSTDVQADTKFAVNAADGGMMEVQLGQLAQTNASSQQVKDFGQHMIDDHSKANAELKDLAQRKNITIPATLSDKNQKDYNDLAQKKGADFDKAYTDYMVKDHKEDIDEFQKEADKGNDPDVKAWAAGKVATLQMHLQMAQSADEGLKR